MPKTVLANAVMTKIVLTNPVVPIGKNSYARHCVYKDSYVKYSVVSLIRFIVKKHHHG